MRDYMFRSRWGALLFVGGIAVTAASLVGTGKGDGAIEQAKRQIAAQKAQASEISSADSIALQSPVKLEPMPDEELIDPALGEDPTPPDQRGTGPNASSGDASEDAPHDAVIVIPDGAENE